jgi:hypothetical protein
MSAVLESHVSERQKSGATWLAVVHLGMREGRRMVLSPVLLLVFGFFMLMAGVEAIVEASLALPTRASAYDFLFFVFALYAGLLFYISCHLVTSSARRTKAEGQLAASPLSSRRRSTGMCLGVVMGPGLVAAAAMVALALLGNDIVWVYGEQQPVSVAELVQLAFTVIGAGLFAVMCATWLRFPGSLPLGLVILVFGTILMSDAERSPINTWPWFAPYIASPDWIDDVWTLMGSQIWHAVYLAGLCGLAFCAVMLREREGRWRWLAVSGGVLAATAVAGALQL